ncbi:MAG: hypothetical protein FJX73_11320 [Armatimonadetes bacterium]|nr:hypothetical protein [Armatimonadota bacterium]
MSSPAGVVLVLLIGAAGGYAGLRLRLPAGALLGALLAVLLAHALIPTLPAIDPTIRRWLQILVGTALGSRVSADTVRRLRRAVPVAALVVAATIAGTLVGGAVVASVLNIDRGTALLASTPGGLPEMVVMADALGRDVPTVVVIQLVRIILTLIVVLPLARLFMVRHGAEPS